MNPSVIMNFCINKNPVGLQQIEEYNGNQILFITFFLLPYNIEYKKISIMRL